MIPTIRRFLGVLACVAVLLFPATAARTGEGPHDPAAAPANPGQKPPEIDMGRCQAMMGGMGGMMGMPMHQGMGMPGMEMGGPGMMPMMHEHMMMRMMTRNPKLAGKMLQMRADMMRAVADVMTRYGKEMESGQWPAATGKAGDQGD